MSRGGIGRGLLLRQGGSSATWNIGLWDGGVGARFGGSRLASGGAGFSRRGRRGRGRRGLARAALCLQRQGSDLGAGGRLVRWRLGLWREESWAAAEGARRALLGRLGRGGEDACGG